MVRSSVLLGIMLVNYWSARITFPDASTGFLGKCRPRKERKNFFPDDVSLPMVHLIQVEASYQSEVLP